MLTTAISSSSFRENLKSTFEKVIHNRSPFLITRKSQEDIVIMPVHEYEELMETLYLTRSTKNAERLFSAIKNTKEGNFTSHTLDETA